jgi:hypothetical protein
MDAGGFREEVNFNIERYFTGVIARSGATWQSQFLKRDSSPSLRSGLRLKRSE